MERKLADRNRGCLIISIVLWGLLLLALAAAWYVGNLHFDP